ncbi:MAG: iron uptake porin, partial [Cyanobacteriota bacterium]|nr:iron uptake porin [Cyanobacteriota bacterium]
MNQSPNQSHFTRLFFHPLVLATALLLAPTGANAKEAPTAKQPAGLQTKGLAETTLLSDKSIAPELERALPRLAQVPSVDELARPQTQTQSQVTSVSQLTDVQPTDWAFQALQSLVERYGCIAGYPDGTYRGNRALTRYEFAAGLNACLDQILNILPNEGEVSAEDLAAIRRLQEEFAAELATLRGRVDALEARTAELEAQQFSTTTKLVGEVGFIVADSFGGDGTDGGDDDSQTIFADRVRLQLVSSFTGRDKLFTRLTAGNIGNSFTDEIGTFEGRFAFDGQNGNDITIDRLHYVFPVGDKLTVTAMASLGGHHFYANTFNPGLEAGGGANGALSRFAERNPIYRIGLGGQGIGLNYRFNDKVGLQAGYLARGGNNPTEGAGLFNGNYSIMGQLEIEPTDSISVGLTYVHGYDPAAGRRFTFGG